MKNISESDLVYCEIALFELSNITPVNPKNLQSEGYKYLVKVIESMMKLENIASNNFGIMGSKEHFAAFWGGLIDTYINKDIEVGLVNRPFPKIIQCSEDYLNNHLFKDVLG